MVEGSLHVDGEYEGLLDCSNTLVVGKKGVMRGRVRADEVLVSGRLEGELICDRLRVLPGGLVKARVSCAQLICEEKGDFVGERFQAGEQSRILNDAEHLLEKPVIRESEPEISIDNLLDSLPTEIKLK